MVEDLGGPGHLHRTQSVCVSPLAHSQVPDNACHSVRSSLRLSDAGQIPGSIFWT